MLEFFYLLESSPAVFIATCAVVGLMAGSFLNVVIYRLPIMLERSWEQQCAELSLQKTGPDHQRDHAAQLFSHPHDEAETEPAFNLVVPRSACPHCGHLISAWENIPVVSYLLLRGKCSACDAKISPRYPIIETISGLLSAYAAWHFGFGWMAGGALVLCWALLALTMIDLDTQLLPDDITLPLLWMGLLFNLFGVFTSLPSAVLGAIFGYLALWSVYWLFKLVTGKEGMGYGDFKLLAALGAWLGWQLLPLVILLSAVVGALVGIFLIIATKRGRDMPIPFGPYLAGGGLIALFWGQTLTSNYLQLVAMP
ncbi:MAG TPA: A24 family peptidase [Gallionella sp.]|nr:A24 family peptidase [Gallionella sp.]